MKTILTQAIMILALLTAGNLQAQVTIGSDQTPNKGALLDLKMDNQGMSTKGLGLPRVALKDIKTKTDLAETMGLTSGTLNATDHVGLVVYNIGKNETSVTTRFCPGIHFWDGAEWQPLVPYTTPIDTRTLQSVTPYGLTHLTASDPTWTALGKNPASYPLGYIGTFTDNRPNDTPQTYHYTRFYVGYTSTDSLFQRTQNLSCDQNPSKTLITTETITNITFEDGIWMGENLRAEKMPDGTAIAQDADSSSTTPRFHYPNLQAANKQYGVLYNWAAAINMGTGAGQTPNPGNVEQGALSENARIQGICPNGWHLPSDRQWTDLENGIIINTSKFSSTPDIGGTLIGYDDTGMRGTNINTAMKNNIQLASNPPNGTSKTAAQGGFDLYLIGEASIGTASFYGFDSMLWSASSASGNNAWGRHMVCIAGGANKGTPFRYILMSVRCKKD